MGCDWDYYDPVYEARQAETRRKVSTLRECSASKFTVNELVFVMQVNRSQFKTGYNDTDHKMADDLYERLVR